MKADIAIIGGTGVYDPSILENVSEEKVLSEYGEVTVKLGEYQGIKTAFMARHGAGHTVPPHLVNYRANIRALQILGVQKIIATAAVGSLELQYRPGDFVIVDQFLDFTKNRVATFYEGGEQGVVHVDMTKPYCPEIRQALIESAKEQQIQLAAEVATYICTEGPRFETPAEIKMYKQLGGQVVGMTSVPEVILAREAEMCYGTIGMVTNYAAGISPAPLTHQEVVDTMKEAQAKLKKLICQTIEIANKTERDCLCKSAIEELGKF
ncbi:MAG: S-methyl-5'-thioadenosine phosphorylase [Bacillota bacterium]|nr:S-methyl-5'-thioadenosine phosphorylase [Bacillota bacterium]